MEIEIVLSKRAQKALEKIPLHIKMKLLGWIDSVLEDGLEETRKFSGYHDELLQGKRRGQRSVRLNRSYRAIYSIHATGSNRTLTILEVTHHEY